MVLFRQPVKSITQKMFIVRHQNKLRCVVELNIEAVYKTAIFPSTNVAIIPIYNPGGSKVVLLSSLTTPQLFFKHLSRLVSQQIPDRTIDTTLILDAKIQDKIQDIISTIPPMYTKDFTFLVTRFSNVGYVKIVCYYEKDILADERFWCDKCDYLWVVDNHRGNINVQSSWRECLMFLIPTMDIEWLKELSLYTNCKDQWYTN